MGGRDQSIGISGRNQPVRAIDDFESVQRSIATQLVKKIPSPEEFKRQLSTEEFHDQLKARINETADFAGVNIFDADGQFINSSERWPTPRINLSDRQYFKALRSGSAEGPVFIELVQSRVSEGQTIVIARKVTNSSGQFLGMITRSISPKSLEDFFSSVVPDSGGVALLHRDGTLLARYPHAEAVLGHNFARLPRFSSTLDHTNNRIVSPIDSDERLVSATSLSKYPLSVLATISVSASLSDWRKQTRFLIWIASLAALVVGTIVLFVTRHLISQHRKLDAAVNNMTQSLLLFDASERLVVCNKRYTEMFGLSPKIVKPGCKFRNIVQHRKDVGSYGGDVDEYCESFRKASKFGHATQNVVQIPDGRWISIVYQPLKKGGWVATMEDVTAQKRIEELNERLAKYDALTELPNRVALLQHLERELDEGGPDKQVAVLFLDTDEFKTVNDSLGHHVGDELLKSVARSLEGCLTPREFVARLGGDEFAVVATNVNGKEELDSLVERIYNAIRRPHNCTNYRLTIDSSIGIAIAPSDGTSCDQLLRNADLAMYQAKAAGRRTHRFYEVGMEKAATERVILEADLRSAIKHDQIDVYYQPIVEMHRNEIVGFEALVRWSHPERGFISPADFIPIAEQSGLIEQLGCYVLRKACQEAMKWPEHIKVAVNVSPVQFKSGVFALKVLSALGETGLSACRLELEITEAVLIADDDAALSILHELRAAGVRVALDDFGTGYSSLSYLRRFPFDKIKIDRSFIADLTQGDRSCGIVKAIVMMATVHNMTITAEGVETEEQRDLLRRLKCDEMQGYLFSAAKPGSELASMFAGNTKDVTAAA